MKRSQLQPGPAASIALTERFGDRRDRGRRLEMDQVTLEPIARRRNMEKPLCDALERPGQIGPGQ